LIDVVDNTLDTDDAVNAVDADAVNVNAVDVDAVDVDAVVNAVSIV
jgi:hypothetical protein